MEIFTIGFTRKSAERFFGTLKRAGIELVIDIRRNNSSQLAGFAKRDDLAYFLRQLCRADYLHQPLLAPTQELLDRYRKGGESWESYEGEFLDLMARRRVEELIDPALFERRSALLCSEPTPERCHRRLVAEYLQQHWRDVEITHL
jgi:uncharacterized protein (DUF488 family)